MTKNLPWGKLWIGSLLMSVVTMPAMAQPIHPYVTSVEVDRMQGTLEDLGCKVSDRAATEITFLVKGKEHQYFNAWQYQEFPPGTLTIYCINTRGRITTPPPPHGRVIFNREGVTIFEHTENRRGR
ncbi:hypothetical protein [Limnospira fusiformis]|uniref:hypothetical protein n=1 Tax=Limnospira fusiformis TaxID=54297 RepID=UPI0034E0D061